MTETLTLGWIGLGKMGLPISTRLAAAGYDIAGTDRDQERISEAAASGVKPAATLADAATRDIVFTSLPDDKALRAVALDGPLFQSMRKGTILVETSTVSPGISAEVAQAADARGIAYLRAPVSGNAAIAHTGNLTCFVSGPKAAFDTFLPVAQAFTRAQKYLGTAEEARYAKLAVNLMIAVSAAMMGESIVLARKGNLAWQDILDVLTNSAVGSPMVHYKAKSLETRDFNSTFSCRQMAKDLDLIVGAGHAADMAMPLATLTREVYGALIGRGEGEADFISTVRLAEWLAGLGEPDLEQNEGRLA
ncbi:putative dehydrogenase [Azorhizobium caulinodans ORS 571]|uniref:Putative dehydrogenase n=1 Tax=Azorhizobium caulinodans (strain ATCC 43989 / DSM 5975 / JCM 20966 / LMG 6465 / NBRC 14845 / NCIMB 13405 / ORS 571) TaxID=438753 RepID=A8I1R8_AZOC5|nr:NAD(P)-dependent oxidoreductase [Azorhizobium caulinodans]BAF87411.1 putative dehydrogenase [Azorhizobium caulinodans ORS 571]